MSTLVFVALEPNYCGSRGDEAGDQCMGTCLNYPQFEFRMSLRDWELTGSGLGCSANALEPNYRGSMGDEEDGEGEED